MVQADQLYSADDLYTIRQRDDEPFREYTARFSNEYSRCSKMDDRMAFSAFRSGIRSSQFRYLVHGNNWTTYNELMKHAAIHAKAKHFNSKGETSAPSRPSAPSDRPKDQAHDCFSSAQTNHPILF
ncbi:hypothetical protein L3X38_010144 [Prunus dulcis]|uniref:Retrotransposon gag domain-containing protein n=1 Tax=Prunus dulcis TaxID=3755 RepID=A0AAD4WFA0_PRUDU|nr:hypothetical protein L3X38_010144 [Prunus dulcis]